MFILFLKWQQNGKGTHTYNLKRFEQNSPTSNVFSSYDFQCNLIKRYWILLGSTPPPGCSWPPRNIARHIKKLSSRWNGYKAVNGWVIIEGEPAVSLFQHGGLQTDWLYIPGSHPAVMQSFTSVALQYCNDVIIYACVYINISI